MIFLLNILFAILAFFLVKWLSDQLILPHPVGVILGVIGAIVVFFANFAELALS